MMLYLGISTDILAIKCIKNYMFLGIGCTLYMLKISTCKILVKINILHPDNIHNIINKSNKKLIIYGKKTLCILSLNVNDNFIRVEQIDIILRFDHWIINIKWLGPLTDHTLTILFANNKVSNFELLKHQYLNIYCKERCLLYSGTISGKNSRSAVIFSGTMFHGILIWKLTCGSDSKFAEVLYRLYGHKGVIFSVIYNEMQNLICSTSDDRTVRIWKVSKRSNHSLYNQSNLDFENVTISLQATMYGHLARVWKAIIIKNTIASIGEDSRICFWSLSGQLLHKIEAHQGAPIWCIELSENDILYTGGGDGSINSWSLQSISNCLHRTLLEDDHISPKNVNFFYNSDILIYSKIKSRCKILHYENSKFELQSSYNLPESFSNYCILELSLNRQLIALASIEGHIVLCKRLKNKWGETEKYKISNSKIFSIKWLNTNILLICTTEGLLYIIKFLHLGIQILSEHVLPYCRERWVTSACIYNNLLICGDRMGSIFVYNLQNNEKNPVQSFKKIHGRLGVQSCIIVNYNLITTGRDGTLKFYKFCNIDSKKTSIEFLYSKTMPMDWISRIIEYKNNYYVLGFKEEKFIIYNLTLKRIIVKIPCGGGHRSWDCIMYNKLTNFAYIQKKQVYVVTIPLDTLFIPPLLTGFHKKQINCSKIIQTSKYNILISGSEDCTLCISYINHKLQHIRFIESFDGHVSSIKCISVLTIFIDESLSKYLIFSGGGRAQLKLWEITIKNNTHSFSNENISCKDLLSYMLHGLDNKRKKMWVGNKFMYNTDAETRYMDISTMCNPNNEQNILIFTACSDGCVRYLSYDIQANQIKLIDTFIFKNRCILKVHSFVSKENIILITMATDGLLNMWNVKQINDELYIKNLAIDGKQNFSLHQSGINCFDTKVLNNHKYILATGGDDNLLSLLMFTIIKNKSESLSVKIISSWKTASAHSSQITGIKLLNYNRFISVGRDQKLLMHQYSYKNSMFHVIFIKEISLCITDVQGITFSENNIQHSCIYGQGFQLLQI